MKLLHWKLMTLLSIGTAVFFACKSQLADTDVNGVGPKQAGGKGGIIPRIFMPTAMAAEGGSYVGHANWRCSPDQKIYKYQVPGSTAQNYQSSYASDDKMNEFRCIPGSVVMVNTQTFCCAATVPPTGGTVEDPAR